MFVGWLRSFRATFSSLSFSSLDCVFDARESEQKGWNADYTYSSIAERVELNFRCKISGNFHFFISLASFHRCDVSGFVPRCACRASRTIWKQWRMIPVLYEAKYKLFFLLLYFVHRLKARWLLFLPFVISSMPRSLRMQTKPSRSGSDAARRCRTRAKWRNFHSFHLRL